MHSRDSNTFKHIQFHTHSKNQTTFKHIQTQCAFLSEVYKINFKHISSFIHLYVLYVLPPTPNPFHINPVQQFQIQPHQPTLFQ